ncbi:MAG: DnaJ domain-containing protein [Myxococcota bacterium]
MTLPRALYLRGSNGKRVGPIALQWLEVLFDARVVDENTPISLSGKAFRPISDWPEINRRLEDVRARLRAGDNPWSETLAARPAEESVQRVEQAVQEAGASARPLSVMIRLAVARGDGGLSVQRPGSRVAFTLRDGRITGLTVEDDELSLFSHLQRGKLVPPQSLSEAQARAADFGGDLGGALVGMGVLPGDLFFETYVNWALSVLAQVMLHGGESEFKEDAGPPPAIPLSFDRLGVFLQAIRLLPRARLSEQLMPARNRPLVLSQVDGVSRESLGLKPRELRVMNAVNGARSLAELLDELGSNDEMTFAILRTVFFATEAGLLVLGDDPQHRQEKAQLEQLRKELGDLEKANEFDVLGVSPKSKTEEVRNAYTELAKKYHPDGLRQEALPELRQLRERAFARIGEAFGALDSESKRKRRAEEIAQDSPDAREAEQRAINAATAETLYKKAEILLRVRKYDEALEHLDQALRLQPEVLDYRILQLHARYLQGTGPDGVEGAAEAADEISQLLGTAESLLGFLTLAQLNKAIGRSEDALRYYRRVLDLDASNSEAKAEVRISTLRKEKTKRNKKGWLS